MKKAVLILAALVVFSSFAFADVTIGAWGRGLYVPAMSGGNGTVIQTTDRVSWGGVPRIGVTLAGKSDNVGFQIDMSCDGAGVISQQDQQKIWVKLFNMLTISVGRIFDDTLRGNAAFGAWNWLRFNGMNGEDLIFMRVGQSGGGPQANMEISLAPVEGLYIYAATRNILGASERIEYNLANGQYGAGYTINGIGMIRAQYVGLTAGNGFSTGIAQAAFKLTAVPGLTVDVGASIPLMTGTAAGTEVNTFSAALYASYALDTLTISLEGSIDIRKATGVDPAFEVGLGVDYGLAGGLGIGLDVRYQNNTRAGLATTASGALGVLADFTMGFSNGVFGIGVEVGSIGIAGVDAYAGSNNIAWAVPIKLEYWF